MGREVAVSSRFLQTRDLRRNSPGLAFRRQRGPSKKWISPPPPSVSERRTGPGREGTRFFGNPGKSLVQISGRVFRLVRAEFLVAERAPRGNIKLLIMADGKLNPPARGWGMLLLLLMF